MLAKLVRVPCSAWSVGVVHGHAGPAGWTVGVAAANAFKEVQHHTLIGAYQSSLAETTLGARDEFVLWSIVT
ncbi:MAG: hypothetical protein WAT12_02900 [Candidatus Nitrotoga sp.]